MKRRNVTLITRLYDILLKLLERAQLCIGPYCASSRRTRMAGLIALRTFYGLILLIKNRLILLYVLN